MAKPSDPKIQPEWILPFVTLVETIGSVVFTWGLFEFTHAARPITIIYLIRVGKVKTVEIIFYSDLLIDLINSTPILYSWHIKILIL